MATSIDFYILSNQTIATAISFICRLSEKVYQNGHWLYIKSNSIEEAREINKRLWTFSDISFIPHSLYEGNNRNPTPILIGCDEYNSEYSDILMNLTREPPEAHERFNRILELIPEEESLKKAGREKFLFYQAQGLSPKTHKIKNETQYKKTTR